MHVHKKPILCKTWLKDFNLLTDQKHIFYIIKPCDSGDRDNFKVGKSHSGTARLKSYSNIYCNDVKIYFVATFPRRGDGYSGQQHVDVFERNFIRALKTAGGRLVRGSEYFHADFTKLNKALKATVKEPAPVHSETRVSTRDRNRLINHGTKGLEFFFEKRRN